MTHSGRILVTGLPGAGKSTVLVELERRGYRVVDTDDPGWREYRPYPTPIDELHRGEYHWVGSRMDALLDTADDRTLFVGGSARNQSAFYSRFDAVILLTAPIEVVLDRVTRRTTNAYGKTPIERAEIVADLREIEPLMRAWSTHELDTNRSIESVVSDVIRIADALAATPQVEASARPTRP